MTMRLILALGLIAFFALAACETTPGPDTAINDLENRRLVLTPAGFDALPGWSADNVFEALQTFQKSCVRILKQPDDSKPFGAAPEFGTYGDWKRVCNTPVTQGSPQAWFALNFDVFQASGDGNPDGLFTGYYEPDLRGSLTRTGPYQTPLYQRPADLVMVDLGEFRDTLKGQRIAGRVVGGNLKPFETRADIVAGKLPDADTLAIVYVDDPVDAFFLQIQGSGRVTLTDGRVMRVGYAAQNGHAYYAVGHDLVKRGALSKDDVSLQTIRAWMAENPDQAAALMDTNPSYVFFTPLTGDGPLGGENIPLTADRSLAVDRARVPYGVPIWLNIDQTPDGGAPMRRLMVAQDTGGAIRGPVRGDVFFGAGDRAEYMAGHMKQPGQWWFLLPKKTPVLGGLKAY